MATQKQKKAVESLSENIGKPMGEVMRESGYSESTSKTPQRLTESDGWKELMEEHLPDEDLAKKHRELLEQKQLGYFVFPKDMEDGEIHGHVEAAGLEVVVIRDSDKGRMAFYSIADAVAKKNALDMAYKLKGRMKDSVSEEPKQELHLHLHSEKITQIITEAREKIKEQLGEDAETR